MCSVYLFNVPRFQNKFQPVLIETANITPSTITKTHNHHSPPNTPPSSTQHTTILHPTYHHLPPNTSPPSTQHTTTFHPTYHHPPPNIPPPPSTQHTTTTRNHYNLILHTTQKITPQNHSHSSIYPHPNFFQKYHLISSTPVQKTGKRRNRGPGARQKVERER